MPDVLMPADSPVSPPPPRPQRPKVAPLSPVSSPKSPLSISSSSSSSSSTSSPSFSCSSAHSQTSQKRPTDSPPHSPPTSPPLRQLEGSLKSDIPHGLPAGRPPKKGSRPPQLPHSGSQGTSLQKSASLIEKDDKRGEAEGKREREEGGKANLASPFGFLEPQIQGAIPDCMNLFLSLSCFLIRFSFIFVTAVSSIKSFIRTEDPSQLVENLEKIGAG